MTSRKFYWLSFVDAYRPLGDRNIGCCIVEADDMPSAIQTAHKLGINPGGEVLGIPFEADSDGHRKMCDSGLFDLCFNTLRSKDEIEAIEAYSHE